MRLKKGDTVMIMAGKDKGKKGKIIRVAPDKGKIVIEGLNVAKRHQRPTRNFPGGIVDKARPLFASKVMLVCPRCSQPARVGSKRVQDHNVRVCNKCDEIIDKV